VLESHYIMSYHYVKQRESPAHFQRLLATEFALYDVYDLVLMVNEVEEAYARARCQTKVAYVARAVSLAAEPPAESSPEESYDLLFVGSSHIPNTEGVHWFYKNVFDPWLRPQGLRWAVAGSVCKNLSFSDPMVTVLGAVDDLDNVYRRSKVVVVPLFRGAGISLKTLEAMGQRKPVVTTPCGRRGLGTAADEALICNSFQENPREVADAILALCSSQSMRREYGRRAAAYINSYFGTQTYGRRMDELLAPLTGGRRDEPQNELQDDIAEPRLRVAA
ncbi:MAG TPA: glycosyltransferase family 4 protein, partial [Pirellulales bacterium]|nr:glycosyltransferase family 4 protein [Pirellulales bacterium]